MLIHECSRGIPSSISVICDNALLSAMGLGHPTVQRAHIVDVCRDLRLTAGPLQPTSRAATARDEHGEEAAAPAVEPTTEQAPVERGAEAKRPFRRLRLGGSEEPTLFAPSTRIVTQ